MTIWVDADACPKPVFEIVVRAAERLGLDVCRVANREQGRHPSAQVRSVRVGQGFDAADQFIVEQVAAGDVVVAADIPLVAAVIGRGARAVGPRGERFTEDNIGDLLAQRNLMDGLRTAGLAGGGPPPFSKKDAERFANELNRLLSRPASR